MKKDYRKDLEKAARQMILVHKAETLARLIVRTIIRNIKVKHAGILLYDKAKNEYIVQISKGEIGKKVPVCFTKVKCDNPIIRFFTDKTVKRFIKQDYLLYSRINYSLKNKRILHDKSFVEFLNKV